MKKSLFLMSLVLLSSWTVFSQGKLNVSFTGIKKIQISTASGNCSLTKASSSSVTVDLKHTYGDNYNPDVKQEGDRLVIREKFKSNSSSGNAEWTLTIPDGVEVDFSTGSGNLDASNLTLDLEVKTGSGDISVRQHKGDLRGNTGSGNITLAEASGEIRANCGSGNIDVEKISGELSVNCGSGDIRLRDSKAIFSANSGSGTVRGTNLTLTGSSGFNSGSGDAKVVLASAPTYNITVNSGSGDAILDFNGNPIAGVVVMKANKKNGAIKAPFEFDKTEEIEQGRDQVVIKKTTQRGNSEVKISVSTGSGEAQIK